MSGRRSHVRFAVHPTADGVLRVLQNVVVQHANDDELVVFSGEPVPVGEELSMELSHRGATAPLRLVTAECLRMVLDGAVTYRLRLTIVADSHVQPATPVASSAYE